MSWFIFMPKEGAPIVCASLDMETDVWTTDHTSEFDTPESAAIMALKFFRLSETIPPENQFTVLYLINLADDVAYIMTRKKASELV
jgi:hypothetical protein